MAKFAVLSSPCEGGTLRTHSNLLNLLPTPFFVVRNGFLFHYCAAKPTSQWDAAVWITGHRADRVCIGGAFFCMLIALQRYLLLLAHWVRAVLL